MNPIEIEDQVRALEVMLYEDRGASVSCAPRTGSHDFMNTLQIPCEVGKVSDGYHTFDELYEHRCTLFLALLKAYGRSGWISKVHHDGSEWAGWFIAGMALPAGDVTYHLPTAMWETAVATGACVRDRAPEWDGHTSADVVKRVQAWIHANEEADLQPPPNNQKS